MMTSSNLYKDRCACTLLPQNLTAEKSNTQLTPLWAPFPHLQPQLFAGQFLS